MLERKKAEIEEFFEIVRQKLIENKEWRLGQSVFNVSNVLYPKVTEYLRGSNMDCFYRNENTIEFCIAVFGAETRDYLWSSNIGKIIKNKYNNVEK